MLLETTVVLVVALQAVAIVLLWQQGRRLKRGVRMKRGGAASGGEAGGVPELLIVNALSKIDHRLGMLEERTQQRAAEPAALRRSVEVPATQMTSLRSAGHHSSASNYELAQQLAREGSGLDQLMACCGLSRHEAELVLRLYAKRA
ncbi:DUF2802 domain-containing protein [Dyella jejuensis]|uniref:DUF2802 domain-containing protein n=1 Tax=Dyella jejuensis TaxID=1432009 RepID=A0ABW8JHG0_9GAMM